MRTPLLLAVGLVAATGCGEDSGPSVDARLTDAIVFVSDRDGYRQLYRMDLDGSRISYLPQDGTLTPLFPDVSPDGRSIAFHDQHSRVKVQAVDNSDSVIVSDPMLFCAFPAWSPDGQRIAMQCQPSPTGQSDLYVVNADGTDFGIMVASPSDESFPTWSPDGRELAFRTDRDGNREIYLADVSSGDLRNLTNSAEAEESSPRWSPDGAWIAVNSRGEGAANPTLELIDPSTGMRRVLLDQLDPQYFPSWSPDGRFVTLSRGDSGDPGRVVRVDIVTGEISPVLPVDDYLDTEPTYAPASGWAP